MLLESELVIAEVGRVRGHFFLKKPCVKFGKRICKERKTYPFIKSVQDRDYIKKS